MPSLDSIDLKWPEDSRAKEQMREFLDELVSCGPVNEAFVEGIEDDPDGEGAQRPDLAEAARARLRAWGTAEDAVERAFELAVWMTREVLQARFPHLDLDVPEDLAHAGTVALVLTPALKAAREAWHEKYSADKASANREWAEYEVLECAVRAFKNLSYLPRRVNVRKYKPKPRSGDRALDICRSVASDCGMVVLYATQLQPKAANALVRLGHPDFRAAGVERRGREALYAAGITEFGKRLEELAVRVVRAYDAKSAAASSTAGDALAVADEVAPQGHAAVELLVESPQLAARPIPPAATTFVAAAEDVLARAVGEVVAHLHTQSAGRTSSAAR